MFWDSNHWFHRRTIFKCGRGRCPRKGWLLPCWTDRRSVAHGGFLSAWHPAGSSVTRSATSPRSCHSTRSWGFRLSTAKWQCSSTPQAQFWWLSPLPTDTSRVITAYTGRTLLSKTSTPPFCNPSVVKQMHFNCLYDLVLHLVSKGSHCDRYELLSYWGLEFHMKCLKLFKRENNYCTGCAYSCLNVYGTFIVVNY